MPAAPAAPAAAPATPVTAPVVPSPQPKPAAAAPSPAPKPAAAPPVPGRAGERSNFFEDEDALPAAVDADEPPKLADKAPETKDDDDAPPAKADDKATDTPKPGEDPPEPVFRTNRELKKAYEAAKKENKQFATRTQELEARLAELEQVANTAKGDTGPLAEQLAAANKKIEEYEGRLRLKAYEESDEFKTKHLAPFKRAEARAFNDVKQLEYIEGVDEDTQQPRMRPANENDFIAIYQLPAGKAYAASRKAFGDSAPLVMQHYHDLHRQQEEMREAIAEYRVKGAEQEQQVQARTAQEREASDRMWRAANADLQARYFNELKIDTDVPEMKELLSKSYATVDKLFNGNGTLTLPERVGLQASVRQRAALFGVTRKQLIEAQKELAEAQKTIEELRGSAPGKPRPKSDSTTPGEFKSIGEEMAQYEMET